MSKPLLTIVTVVYNAVDTIEKTIKSVISFKSEWIEYIILDGDSSDGTFDIIEKYNTYIDVVISERDDGVYNAMNKGIKIARGEFILNINSGDLLVTNPVPLIQSIPKFMNFDLFLFNVRLSDSTLFRSSISYLTKIKNTIHHQGVVYKKKSDSFYNEEYKVFSDFDFNQRLIKKQGFNYYYFDVTLCLHSLDGISNKSTYFSENYHIIKRNQQFYHLMLSFFYNKYLGLKRRMIKLCK